MAQVGRMTIPQARFLMRHADAVDGHRETARLVVEGIVDVGVAGGLLKRKEKDAAARLPDAATADVVVPETLIPELEAALAARMQAQGWRPPPKPESLPEPQPNL